MGKHRITRASCRGAIGVVAAMLASLGCSDDADVRRGPSPREDAGPVKSASLPGPLDRLRAATRILWVGAHPDDEVTVAALLGEVCVEAGVSCHFLVLTRGEVGPCGLPGGCQPDLGTVRAAEMEAAASLFGATLTQWDLRDSAASTTEAVLVAWASRVGGRPALLQRLEDELIRLQPELVLTFDPRHGTTCHEEHRATGQLVLSAVRNVDFLGPDDVYLVASRLEYAVDDALRLRLYGFAPLLPSDPTVWIYDASRPLPTAGKTAWSFLIEATQRHPSQIRPDTAAALQQAPPAAQIVALLPQSATADDDPRYLGLCPSAHRCSITSPWGLIGNFVLEADRSCADGNQGPLRLELRDWHPVGLGHTRGSVSGLSEGHAYRVGEPCNRYRMELRGAAGEAITLLLTWDESAAREIRMSFETIPSGQSCSTDDGGISNVTLVRQ